MKIKFNKYERLAGLFVIGAVVGILIFGVTVAVKQSWFETKVGYISVFSSAEGLHQGTIVQMLGLRAGAVDDVELLENSKVKVKFYVYKRFQNKITKNTRVQLIRPFVIGERVLEVLVVSDDDSPELAAHSEIPSNDAFDIMTLLSGKHLNAYLVRIGALLENVKVLLEAFASKDRAEALVRIFDKMDPLISDMSKMSKEMTKLSRQMTDQDYLKIVMQNMSITLAEMNKILPEVNKTNPEIGKQIGSLTSTVHQIGSDLTPETRSRMLEALNEMVVVLKAMQKSIFLRGSVEDVHEEENARRPAAK